MTAWNARIVLLLSLFAFVYDCIKKYMQVNGCVNKCVQTVVNCI